MTLCLHGPAEGTQRGAEEGLEAPRQVRLVDEAHLGGHVGERLTAKAR